MSRRLLVLGIFALCLIALAGSASAGCIKCDQSTGYYCYMSIYGTYSGCDSPSWAGCVLWGSCSSGSGTCADPTKKCPYQNGQLWSSDYKLASVTISNVKSEKLVAAPAGHEIASR